jgi:hypothetical protein
MHTYSELNSLANEYTRHAPMRSDIAKKHGKITQKLSVVYTIQNDNTINRIRRIFQVKNEFKKINKCSCRKTVNFFDT